MKGLNKQLSAEYGSGTNVCDGERGMNNNPNEWNVVKPRRGKSDQVEQNKHYLKSQHDESKYTSFFEEILRESDEEETQTVKCKNHKPR